VTQPDSTFEELKAMLAADGHAFSVSALWRFSQRRTITLKKGPRTPPSRSDVLKKREDSRARSTFHSRSASGAIWRYSTVGRFRLFVFGDNHDCRLL
jgi:hypothetical protein